MTGVNQSSYLIPKENFDLFIKEIRNLVPGEREQKSKNSIFLIKLSLEGKLHPFLSLWETNLGEESRKVDLHWLNNQIEVSKKVEFLTLKHGGTKDTR